VRIGAALVGAKPVRRLGSVPVHAVHLGLDAVPPAFAVVVALVFARCRVDVARRPCSRMELLLMTLVDVLVLLLIVLVVLAIINRV
jgi:hypothetical protein